MSKVTQPVKQSSPLNQALFDVTGDLILFHHAIPPRRLCWKCGRRLSGCRTGRNSYCSLFPGVGELRWGCRWEGGLRSSEGGQSRGRFGGRLRGCGVPLLSVPVLQCFPVPGVRVCVPAKLLPHLGSFCPRSSHTEALLIHHHPLSTLLSLPGFICHDSSSHCAEPWYLCSLTCHRLLSKCEPCQGRGLSCVIHLCISPGTEARLSEWELHGMAAAFGCGSCAISGACAQETRPVALPSSRRLGGAQGGEPPLPGADSDACCCMVFGPALPLHFCEALPWVLGFCTCPRWVGTPATV